MPTVEHLESTWEPKEADEWLPGEIDRIVDGDPHPQYGPSIKFIIHLDGDIDPISEEPYETWAFCGARLTKRTKLYRWLTAIDADIIPSEGGRLDLSILNGRAVDVMFENYVKDDGTDGQKIVKMRARKASTMREKQKTAAKAAKPKAKPASAPVEDDDVF
jgi:hypothetical protein